MTMYTPFAAHYTLLSMALTGDQEDRNATPVRDLN